MGLDQQHIDSKSFLYSMFVTIDDIKCHVMKVLIHNETKIKDDIGGRRDPVKVHLIDLQIHHLMDLMDLQIHHLRDLQIYNII